MRLGDHAFGEGGWFNEFVMALMLYLPLAARAFHRRARLGRA